MAHETPSKVADRWAVAIILASSIIFQSVLTLLWLQVDEAHPTTGRAWYLFMVQSQQDVVELGVVFVDRL